MAFNFWARKIWAINCCIYFIILRAIIIFFLLLQSYSFTIIIFSWELFCLCIILFSPLRIIYWFFFVHEPSFEFWLNTVLVPINLSIFVYSIYFTLSVCIFDFSSGSLTMLLSILSLSSLIYMVFYLLSIFLSHCS